MQMVSSFDGVGELILSQIYYLKGKKECFIDEFEVKSSKKIPKKSTFIKIRNKKSCFVHHQIKQSVQLLRDELLLLKCELMLLKCESNITPLIF